MRGIFIAFDGPNGVGKSTIINEVSKKLMDLGYDVKTTKEPTETVLGNFIRKSEDKYSSYTLACLVAADRYYDIDTYITPHLNDGKIILCDRYICSSLVLQRIDGLDINFLWNMNSKAIIPDMYFVLMASSLTLQERLKQRDHLSRFERDNKSKIEIDYFKKAIDFLAKKNFKIELVNTENDIKENIREIIYKIEALINEGNLK